MARIIGGAGKGRRLKTPAGLETRPTGARVRQSLFDILAPRLPGSRFLDVCAGGGGVGLEALSRGAARVAFVDSSGAAVAAIRDNVLAIGGLPRADVYRQEALTALKGLARAGRRFDLVYLDPPYESDLYDRLLEALGRLDLLDSGAIVVAEHFHKRALPERIGRLILDRAVRIGDHVLSFYRLGVEENA